MSAERYDGARAAVLGLARSGEAAARALLARGASVVVLDAAEGEPQRARAARIPGARILLGREVADDVEGADLVVASPGVPPRSPWIKAAEAAGVAVWSEVELAYRLGVRPLVAVTGTKGKTTTTAMAAAALRAGGFDAATAGNIGSPLVEAAAGTIVAEVSSAQLWAIDRFRAPVAVMLAVVEDHLDWHGSAEAYRAAKARIFENQAADEVAIHHRSAAALAAGARARRVAFDEGALPEGGAGVEGGWIVVPAGRVAEVDRLRSRARPHRAAAIAAAAAACAAGADPGAVGGALAAFEPMRGRLEPVATRNGVTYVDDTKATNPHATLAALAELDRVVLIAGGRNKGLDLGLLATAAPRLVAAVAIGEAAGEVEAALAHAGVAVVRAGSMREAVEAARERARPGDTVLLSPACASLDMFADSDARGDAFRAAVEALEGERG